MVIICSTQLGSNRRRTPGAVEGGSAQGSTPWEYLLSLLPYQHYYWGNVLFGKVTNVVGWGVQTFAEIYKSLFFFCHIWPLHIRLKVHFFVDMFSKFMLNGIINGDHWPDKNVLWARRWTLIHCSGRAVLRGRNWNFSNLAVNVSTSIGITLQAMLAQACVLQLSSARDHLETGILSGSVMPPTSWRTASWSTRSTRYYLEVHVKYQVLKLEYQVILGHLHYL